MCCEGSYMKKVFVLLLVMVCSLFTPVSATDFVKVSSNIMSDWYIDVDSVNVVRYEPPLYTIDAVVKHVSLERGVVVLYKSRFFYDINTKEMKISTTEGSLDNGNTWDVLPDRQVMDISKGSNGYNTGNAVFYTAYRMWFSSL